MLKFIFTFFILFSSILFAESMNFTLKTNYMDRRAEIYASGDIEKGTTLKFINFIKQNNIGRATVFFNSNGGSLMEGIYMGEVIRQMGFDSTIGTLSYKREGVCASACSYAFAGGVARYIYYDKQKIGLHQFFLNDGVNRNDVGSTQNTTATIAKHLSDMGISERAFVLASSTKSSEMKWLSKAEAISLNFANNGKNETTAEIRLMSGENSEQKPYLKIKQVKVEGTVKLYFYCKNKTMHLQAGLVTNADTTSIEGSNLKRNYFALDYDEFLVRQGSDGIRIDKDTLWFSRTLYDTDIDRLLNANIMDLWVEKNASVMRWGIGIELHGVKSKMETFMKGCSQPKIDLDTTLSYF